MRSKSSRLIACVSFLFCVYFVSQTTSIFFTTTNRKGTSLSNIMCTPVCAALGYLPQGEFDEEAARKDAEVRYVFVVVFVKCIFSVHLYIVFTRFSGDFFPRITPD